jgi:hypothetical protein
MRPKGKHITIDVDNPQALGVCDYTGFVHLRKDLVKQMEYRGNRLVWTGFLVGKDYVDVPNPQLKPPMLRPDPIPVRIPRLRQPTEITWNNIYQYWNLLLDPLSNLGLLTDGEPALPENQRLQLAQNAYFGSGAF